MRGSGYVVVATAASIALYGCNGELVTPLARNLTPTTSQKALTPGQTGQWSAVMSWPIIGAHMSVMPDGKFLAWTSNDIDRTMNTPYVYVWDPANPTVFVQKPNAATDVFCSSHSFLIDGKLFVGGGHIADNTGSKDGNIFDYLSSSWSQLPKMRAGRWYPSTVMLGNGEIGIAAGGDENSQSNTIPEVWNGTNFRLLAGAPLALPVYPWLHLAPDGRVFNAGPSQQTRFLNPSGDGEWIDAGQHISGTYRDYGTAVMYAPGKLIAIGGGDPPVNTAELVDLNVGTTWTSTSSMQYARRQLNGLALADGKVLVVGGSSGPGFNNEAASVLTPELWDPATGAWTVMMNMTIPRTYHSTAVLMPDARVLSAGGGRCGSCQVNHLDAQIFSPPYLFNADGSVAIRPTITFAPATLNRGQVFTVTTPDAARITRATLARLPSTSHAFNMNQAFVSLPATQVAGGVQLTAPVNPNLVPAGHYMLFLLDGAGIPSVAKITQLLGTAAPPPAPPAPPAPSALTASTTSSQINLHWNDNSNSESSFRIERCTGTGCTNFAEIAFVGANVTNYANTGVTTGTTYLYRVRSMNAAGPSAYTNTATATIGSSTFATLTNRLSVKCMEVPGVSHTNGTQLTIYDCHGGANQLWATSPVGATGSIVVYGDKCVGGTTSNTIIIFDCLAGEARQQWTRTAAAEIKNFAGQCIEVTGKATANGSLLVLATCDGSNSQKWDSSSNPPPTNTPPTANFSSSCNALACSFTNTSTDSDGTIASSSWTFGDGTTSTATNPSKTYASGGTYSVSLTVTDNQGATNSTTKSVTVTAAPPPNTPPTANFSSSCNGLACSFTNTSTDSDGTIASSSWTFGDGTTSTATSPSHTYATGNTYSVSLTVTDNQGATNSTTKSVTVTAPPPTNTPPTANFSSSCNGLACSFTNTSTDSDGTIASSSWNFGDGSTSTTTNPSKTYASGGTYSVSLTVTDNQGATNSITKSVTVSAPAPIALTAQGSKVKGVQQVDLSWTGATTSTVAVYRNGVIIANPANNTTTQSGTYHDNLNKKGGGVTYTYKVCNSGSTTFCSANVPVAF